MRRLKIPFTILLVLFHINIFAENSKFTADDFLKMNTDRAFDSISEMNQTEAEELISNIRQTGKKEYKQIDNFYFLISHLESIKAIKKEQKRLQSLNLVYGLGFLLFTGFTLYLFLSQKRTIKELKAYLDK